MGDRLSLFVGNDRLFTNALRNKYSGCITALANVYSEELRKIWEAYLGGRKNDESQARVSAAREIFERYPFGAAFIKFLLAEYCDFPQYAMCPPLEKYPDEIKQQIIKEIIARELIPETTNA